MALFQLISEARRARALSLEMAPAATLRGTESGGLRVASSLAALREHGPTSTLLLDMTYGVTNQSLLEQLERGLRENRQALPRGQALVFGGAQRFPDRSGYRVYYDGTFPGKELLVQRSSLDLIGGQGAYDIRDGRHPWSDLVLSTPPGDTDWGELEDSLRRHAKSQKSWSKVPRGSQPLDLQHFCRATPVICLDPHQLAALLTTQFVIPVTEHYVGACELTAALAVAAAVSVHSSDAQEALILTEMIQGFARLMEALAGRGDQDVRTQLYMLPVAFAGRREMDGRALTFSFEPHEPPAT